MTADQLIRCPKCKRFHALDGKCECDHPSVERRHRCRACGHCISEGCPQGLEECPINQNNQEKDHE